MLIRSAFWIGSPKPGMEQRFRDELNRELVPAMRAFPGVRDVKVLWPQRREDHPPDIACQVLVEFDGPDDLQRMLASPERRAFRPRVLEIAALFDGVLSHIDYEVGSSWAVAR